MIIIFLRAILHLDSMLYDNVNYYLPKETGMCETSEGLHSHQCRWEERGNPAPTRMRFSCVALWSVTMRLRICMDASWRIATQRMKNASVRVGPKRRLTVCATPITVSDWPSVLFEFLFPNHRSCCTRPSILLTACAHQVQYPTHRPCLTSPCIRLTGRAIPVNVSDSLCVLYPSLYPTHCSCGTSPCFRLTLLPASCSPCTPLTIRVVPVLVSVAVSATRRAQLLLQAALKVRPIVVWAGGPRGTWRAWGTRGTRVGPRVPVSLLSWRRHGKGIKLESELSRSGLSPLQV